MNITGAHLTKDVTKNELVNKEISYEAALEGMVLLENNGILPIKPCKIALYGYGADRTIKGGTGSGEVNERNTISIKEGLSDLGFEVLTQNWIDKCNINNDKAYKEYGDLIRGPKVLDTAFNNPFIMPPTPEVLDEDLTNETDTCIYVLSRQAGEGADKKIENGEFDLYESEIKSLNRISNFYKNTILVINTGSYMCLETNKDIKLSALIFFCQEGMEGGRAFADIITGKKNFSGKLTDTWAKNYSDIPYGDEYSYRSGCNDEFYKENIYVGYKYFDTFNVKPLYSFGYGKSYTNFEIKYINASIINQLININVDVKNIGNYFGKEVVQVYSTLPRGNYDKEYKRLVAFNKTKELKANEVETLELSFNLYDLASYDELSATYYLDEGNYIVKIGNSSDNLVNLLVIKVNEKITLKVLKNICFKDVEFEELKSNITINEDISNLDILTVGDITEEVITYNSKFEFSDEVNKIVDSLSVKELIDVCVGVGFNTANKSAKGLFAPGAVGKTISNLNDKGIMEMLLADGPAGLRLLKESAISKKDKVKFVDGNYMFACMVFLPKLMLKFQRAKKDDKRVYQYTTSFPVATAIAQSWNIKLAEKIGEAISREMDEYNITFFLGPGMNIHKNPLCGRNFEYYSEDCLLTGKIAAAISRGINSIPGNYATIKHYACNNAEYERFGSNSHISERALREIYLKGFEIAVKEGNVKSVMSSYNKINGVFTPNSKDILTSALRYEWGFDGLVMSDWSSTKRGRGDNAIAIKSGNDLIMPGKRRDKRKIYKGYRSKAVSIDELKLCASNIIKIMLDSNAYKKNFDKIKKA